MSAHDSRMWCAMKRARTKTSTGESLKYHLKSKCLQICAESILWTLLPLHRKKVDFLFTCAASQAASTNEGVTRWTTRWKGTTNTMVGGKRLLIGNRWMQYIYTYVYVCVCLLVCALPGVLFVFSQLICGESVDCVLCNCAKIWESYPSAICTPLLRLHTYIPTYTLCICKQYSTQCKHCSKVADEKPKIQACKLGESEDKDLPSIAKATKMTITNW